MLTQKTIEFFDRYTNEQLDKMGSDYFPLSVKLNRFKGLTLGYIRDNTRYFEVTQEVAEDIQTLFVRLQYNMTQDQLRNQIFFVNVPGNLFRLGTFKPFRSTGLVSENQSNTVMTNSDESSSKVKRITIIKDGQEEIFSRSPYRKASPEYPTVKRYSGKYMFDFGVEPDPIYNRVMISYIKEPKFGREDVDDDLLVDLPDVLVERIISKTCDSLRFQTSDEAATSNFQFNRTYLENK